MLKLTHAIILAAGLGTRMRPLTNDIPKPLIQVKDKALIDWCLEWLADAGIHEVVINSSYLAEKLEDHVSVHANVKISKEPSPPLETGGGIAKALPMLGNAPFLAMNSDAIFLSKNGGAGTPSPLAGEGWDEGAENLGAKSPPPLTLTLRLEKSMPMHRFSALEARKGRGDTAHAATSVHPIKRLCDAWSDDLDFLMLLVAKENAIGWEGGKGDFVMDEAGRIRRPYEGEDAPYIFTGVEIIHPRVFEGCPAGAFSLSRLWNERRDADGWFTHMRAIVHDGAWLNVGNLAGLAAAEEYF